MFDVIAIGEILIDFTPAGKSEHGNPLFERNPGGAPANLLAGLAKLGRSTAFIGKVGDDVFGHYLENLLETKGINTDGLRYSEESHTTMVFVELNDQGERSFTFFRRPGADSLLSKEELDISLLQNTKIFHFGSVSMTREPSRTATIEAAKIAKQGGAIISFDPNIRESLWDDKNIMLNEISKGLELADIVKISDEELEFITGTKDITEGSKELYDSYHTKLILVTMGPEGSFYRCNNLTCSVAGNKIQAVDTTGAGDAFLSGVLYQILERDKSIEEYNAFDLKNILTFGNIMGSLVVSKKGAISSMPSMSEIEQV